MRTMNAAERMSGTPSKASATEIAAVASHVLLPVLAGGAIVRRPRGMHLVERTQWDRRGIDLARTLRDRHGPGPLYITARGRPAALVLDPADAHRILTETPEPFTPASQEKIGSLAQFQPHGVLISSGRDRERRRAFHEAVLQTPHPLHGMAGDVARKAAEEADQLLHGAEQSGELAWEEFHAAWWRLVRRIVLGDGARDDTVLTAQLDRLRSAANWSVLSSRRHELRGAFMDRLRHHLGRAESGSLAAEVARMPAEPGTDPVGQVPHWLFAYDAAGIATLRALALLASHPDQAALVRGELAGYEPGIPQELPFLRACALESVRLFPTTPLLLRESTEETWWGGEPLPAGTTFVLYTPYLHRAEPAAPHSDSFVPHIWRDGEARTNPALVPFSSGPAGCPGENLVLLTVSSLLAALLHRHTYTLTSTPSLHPTRAVPATLDHFTLRFRVHRG